MPLISVVFHLLNRSNISFVRLDGTLNQQQREKVIKQFSEESNILVCQKKCGLFFFFFVPFSEEKGGVGKRGFGFNS